MPLQAINTKGERIMDVSTNPEPRRRWRPRHSTGDRDTLSADGGPGETLEYIRLNALRVIWGKVLTVSNKTRDPEVPVERAEDICDKLKAISQKARAFADMCDMEISKIQLNKNDDNFIRIPDFHSHDQEHYASDPGRDRDSLSDMRGDPHDPKDTKYHNAQRAAEAGDPLDEAMQMLKDL